MKKLLTIILSMILIIVPFSGCNNSGIDKTKTQLYWGAFEGGIGVSYLEDYIIPKFEEKYINTSFEPGKTGVQVIKINESKEDYTGSALAANYKYMDEDIFITNDVEVSWLIESGVAKDITSLMTEAVYGADGNLSENATASIASKMEDYVVDYYNVGTKASPQYYAIPYAATTMGIVYDADFFAEKGYYFNTDGELICNTDYTNTTLSLGADGVASYDDGLPVTYEQFKSLVSAIRGEGFIPFTWAYQPVIYYRIAPLIAFWAQYEGANDFALNYTYSGTDSQFGEINEQNAYQLYGQNGRLAALTVAKDIISNPKNYSTHCFYSSQTNEEAQAEFISSIRGVNGQKRIAMLFEGGWWENESKETFDEMAGMNSNYGYGKRNFKFMPMPSFIGTEGVPDQTYTGRTINIQQTQANICVNSKSNKTELIAKFLQFLHTEESLRTFTKQTGVFKPFDYELSDSDYNSLTPFARSCWDVISDDSVEKVAPLMTSQFRSFLGTKVADREWQTSLSGYGQFKEPLEAFYNNPKITAKEYFDGSTSYYSSSMWANEYSNYLMTLD